MVSIESQVMPGAAVTGVALVMTGDGRWSLLSREAAPRLRGIKYLSNK